MTTDSITTPSSDTDRAPWFAIRLFALRQTAVDDYLKQCGLETFIPRQWVDYEDRKGKVHHELRPVVHNIIFVKKTVDTHTLAGYLYDSNFKLSVIRKLDSNDYYEIPARQMKEFRIMCNPELELKQYLSDQEARMKPGSRVFVKFGPLKGLSGRLVRISKKYYLLKEVPGMAVALKVGRWCCVPEVEMQALQTAKTI